MRYYDEEDLWKIFGVATDEWLSESMMTADEVQYEPEQVRALVKTLEHQDSDDVLTFSSHFFVPFKRQLHLQKLVEERAVDSAIKAVESLWCVLGNGYKFVLNAETIKELLNIGARLRNTYTPPVDTNIEYIAKSARRLSAKYSGITVAKGTMKLGEGVAAEIFNEIDRKMAQLGGRDFLAHYEGRAWMGQRYSSELDRYMVSRHDPLTERSQPIHFLLQLAGRHLTDHSVRKWEYNKGLYHEVIELATDFLEVCDLQNTSGISYSMLDPKEIAYDALNDLFYCKMCVPFQYSAKFILESLKYLICPWFESAGRKYRYREYYSLVEFFLKTNWWESGKRIFTFEDIYRETGIARYKLKEILEDISQPACKVNIDFTSFDGRTNFFEYPLVFFQGQGYVCFDWHFSGIGFVTRIHSIIKQNDRNLDVKQGPELEKWLHHEMEKRGYWKKSGHYPEKNGLPEGECDFVLKDKKLCFIELKKRAVIQDFNEMDDVKLWGSIGQGMLNAQKQGFSHEWYLMNNHSIDFDDGDSILIEPTLLPAVKVSVCYGEHDYICSKAYVAAMMKTIFHGGRIKTIDPNRQKEVEKFNQYSKNLRDIIRKKSKRTGEKIDVNEIITHSIFCSVQQLLQAIWNTSGEQEFFEIVKEWQYRVDGYVDQYITLFLKIQQRKESGNMKVSHELLSFAEKKGNVLVVS